MTWEVPDLICDKRLRPMVPILIEAMERHAICSLRGKIRTRSLEMSVARSTRRLRGVRLGAIASGLASHRDSAR